MCGGLCILASDTDTSSAESLILRLAPSVDNTLQKCRQASGELVGMGPEPLACLCRAVSCIVSGTLCPAMLVYLAVSCPVGVVSTATTVGIVHDSTVLPPACCPRVIAVLREERDTPPNRLCVIIVRGIRFTVTLRDSVSAAQSMPVSFAALRTSLQGVLPRGGLARWPRQLENGARRRLTLQPDQSSTEALVRASLADPDAVAAWLQYLAGEEPFKFSSSQACRQHATLLPLLPSSYARAVQNVLPYVRQPQPDLSVPTCAVYAMVSPLWGKCYVGAVGLNAPRRPIDRWLEHASQARLWRSATSQWRYGKRCPPLYAAMRSVTPANVCFVILEVANAQTLLQRERFFIRLLEPVLNIKGISGSVAP